MSVPRYWHKDSTAVLNALGQANPATLKNCEQRVIRIDWIFDNLHKRSVLEHGKIDLQFRQAVFRRREFLSARENWTWIIEPEGQTFLAVTDFAGEGLALSFFVCMDGSGKSLVEDKRFDPKSSYCLVRRSPSDQTPHVTGNTQVATPKSTTNLASRVALVNSLNSSVVGQFELSRLKNPPITIPTPRTIVRFPNE